MEFKAIHPRSISFLMRLYMLLFAVSWSYPEVHPLLHSGVMWGAVQILRDLGIILPEASSPVANYVNAVRSGNLLFLAGKGPGLPDGTFITGKVGQDLTIEEGKAAARLVAINQLAVLKAELGDLNKVKRIVKVLGMVNCNSEFTQQPQVINGFSDLMVEVFGEKGKHARSAVGMNALPMNIAVEVELIVEIEDN
mgnify:CR=1 FL=1